MFSKHITLRTSRILLLIGQDPNSISSLLHDVVSAYLFSLILFIAYLSLPIY